MRNGMNLISEKIKRVFSDVAIFKDPELKDSIFSGRNLPSFVKDFLVSKHINLEGVLNKEAIKNFLEKHIPDNNYSIKSNIMNSREPILLLTRFVISTDILGGKTRFSIPDAGIKLSEGIIPDYLVSEHKNELIDGEIWGVIRLVFIPPLGREKGCIQMVDYKPFRPYKVNLEYFKECRRQFTLEEWIDVLISAMEYNPEGFEGIQQKLEFLSRLLPFVEPRLNLIELAPKGTGKSYVFGNLSKFGWLVSGGKVSRAKLFYDKSKQQPGFMKHYDFVAFDEIQTIIFQDPSEMQAILKAYLEAGKATVDNYEFLSECSIMLMGNIELTNEMLPTNERYFNALPENFKESALLDRFHGFIEGWHLPRLNKNMLLKAWTLNVEYFSEILHLLRVESEYSLLVNKLIYAEEKSDLRDLKAVQRIATAYSKLLFPHITNVEDMDKDEFFRYCLEPAIRRRAIIKEQCHKIDVEFKIEMPIIKVK